MSQPSAYRRPGGSPHIYHLTTGPDHVVAAPGPDRIDALANTLSAGDVIFAGPLAEATLVLQGGGQFNLAAPAILHGITRVTDHGIGDTTITLRAGLAVTLQLGTDFPTVIGADDRATIIGGTVGFDTVDVGGAGETIRARTAGMAINLPLQYAAAAHIEGGGITTITLDGAPGSAVTLGANLQGIAALTLASPDLTVSLGAAGIATTNLAATSLHLTATKPHSLVVDYAGGNTIALTAPGQTLELPDTGLTRGGTETLAAIAPTDSIIVDLPPANSRLVYDPATGVAVLTDTANNVSEYLMLPIGLPSLSLSAAPDLPNGDTGTRITVDPVADPVPCFAAGTTLATARGEIPVERICVGDQLLTLAGTYHPVRWVGQKTVRCAAYRRQDLVQPIRILPGAFGPNLPRAAVLLSPDHGVHLAGHLIPIRHLVNGATIRREPHAIIRYFHIELDRHAIALAAGLPVETYLDTGNRALLCPQAPALPRIAGTDRAGACAPLLESGPRLQAQHQALIARAEALGFATTAEPAIRLLANHKQVPCQVTGTAIGASFAQPPRTLTLRSRAAAPAETDPTSTDRRTLGIALFGITITAGATARRFDAFAPVWGSGFYPPERDADGSFRWSNGHGQLNPGIWAGITGPCEITCHVKATLRYRVAPPPPPPARQPG